MTTRRDFLKTMSLASAGLALGSGELLNAQTISSKKGKNSLYWHWKPWRANYTGFCTYGYGRGCGSV